MRRRSFLAVSATGLAATASAKLPQVPLRVGVIGHTGRGNYGHGLDTVWLQIPETRVVAAADPDRDGLAKELVRLKVDRGFADYREMLREINPEIVAICPRHADQHHAMCLAAAESGAKGIYLEKPLCRTPAESDEIKAACSANGVKVAVAHRNRYHPTLQAIDAMIADGKIGKLLEIRGRGKGDRRGGVEDLWVLGSHVLNLVHYFGGQPRTCSAVILKDGRRVTKDDVTDGPEGLGAIAGNELHARFEMERGFTAYFDSVANDDTQNAGFGLRLIGSRGVIAIHCDRFPVAHYRSGNPFEIPSEAESWIPITSGGPGAPEILSDLPHFVGHHIIPARDLVASIRADRQPVCDLDQAAMTVEMICAVLDSHTQDSQAVKFPLLNRHNALEVPVPGGVGSADGFGI